MTPILKDLIPIDVLAIIEAELDTMGIYRFHASCNIGAKTATDIILSEPWETT